MSTQGQMIALITRSEYFDHVCNINILTDIRPNTNQTILRTCDTFWIDAIRIKNEYDINVLTSLDIVIGPDNYENSVNLSVPFELLTAYNKPRKTKQYTSIDVPYFFFFGTLPTIPLVALYHHEVYVRIKGPHNFYYDMVNLELMFDNEHRHDIANKICTTHTNSYAKIIQPKQSLPARGYLSGIIMRTRELPKHDTIKIIINGEGIYLNSRHIMRMSKESYVMHMIQKYLYHIGLDQYVCENIHNYFDRTCLIWYPIGHTEQFDSTNKALTIDLSKVSGCIETSQDINGGMYLVTNRMMKVYEGFGGLLN
jgi:hypothetical protein